MPTRTFLLPDLGEGLEEAEVSRWLVAEGERVELNQPLAEVETAKATVEIPSPHAGVVARLHAAEGDLVRVGAPLVTFEVEEAAGLPVPPPEAAQSQPEGPAGPTGPVPASPAVRRLARDLGVDLAALAGTGPGGRVTREDVERAARQGPGSADVERIPVRGVRRLIAERLTRAVREIPHVTTFRTVDCLHLEALRRDLGVSPLPIVVRALAEACRAHPFLNASFDASRGEILLYRRCHVGIATDTERGLLVPVVRDAGTRGIGEIAAEIERLARAARDGTISPDEMAGGTITVTNTGSYGSEFGTPIINPPQGAILGLGVIEPRALVVGGEVVARPACTLSLSFDHRLLDGRAAGLALGELVDLLERPERLRALPR